MAISRTQIPMWQQRRAEFPNGHTPECITKWQPWQALNRPGVSETLEGETFTPGLLRKGDKIHDLPYEYSKRTLAVPMWQASCKQTAGPFKCVSYEYRGDGRVFTAISGADLTWNSTNSPSLAAQQSAMNLSVMKAKAGLRRADASIPMLLRERAETIQALGDQSKRILTAVRDKQSSDVDRFRRLTRGRPSPEKVKAIAQMIANEHLQWIFGILPFMEDMAGIAKNVQRESFKTLTGRGRHTAKVETNTITLPSYSSYGFGRKLKMEARYSVRTTLKADVKLEVLGRLQTLGFNPLQTLYDFVPLSFVTGWFSNFNYWIQSLDPLYSSTYRTGSSSIWKEMTVEKSSLLSPVGARTPKGSGSSHGYDLSATRVVHATEPPLGDLEFYNNFSFHSVTAAASLLIQRKLRLADRAIKVRPFRYQSRRPINLPSVTYRS